MPPKEGSDSLGKEVINTETASVTASPSVPVSVLSSVPAPTAEGEDSQKDKAAPSKDEKDQSTTKEGDPFTTSAPAPVKEEKASLAVGSSIGAAHTLASVTEDGKAETKEEKKEEKNVQKSAKARKAVLRKLPPPSIPPDRALHFSAHSHGASPASFSVVIALFFLLLGICALFYIFAHHAQSPSPPPKQDTLAAFTPAKIQEMVHDIHRVYIKNHNVREINVTTNRSGQRFVTIGGGAREEDIQSYEEFSSYEVGMILCAELGAVVPLTPTGAHMFTHSGVFYWPAHTEVRVLLIGGGGGGGPTMWGTMGEVREIMKISEEGQLVAITIGQGGMAGQIGESSAWGNVVRAPGGSLTSYPLQKSLQNTYAHIRVEFSNNLLDGQPSILLKPLRVTDALHLLPTEQMGAGGAPQTQGQPGAVYVEWTRRLSP